MSIEQAFFRRRNLDPPSGEEMHRHRPKDEQCTDVHLRELDVDVTSAARGSVGALTSSADALVRLTGFSQSVVRVDSLNAGSLASFICSPTSTSYFVELYNGCVRSLTAIHLHTVATRCTRLVTAHHASFPFTPRYICDRVYAGQPRIIAERPCSHRPDRGVPSGRRISHSGLRGLTIT